jgi:FkbM family methyltransferase
MTLKRRIRVAYWNLMPPALVRIIGRIAKGRYRALDNLDRKMEKYLEYRNGFYVELGANDGITQSNTYFLERGFGWRGLLIEPAPHNFLKCLVNRSKLNTVCCAACVSFEYKDKFVEIIYSNLMSTPSGVESDIEDPEMQAERGVGRLPPGEVTFTYGAKAATLNSLLIQSGAPRLVDFLSLDVEGAEIEVLKGVDHAFHRFKYILVECRNFSKINDYLGLHDYEYVEALSSHDFLFRSKLHDEPAAVA